MIRVGIADDHWLVREGLMRIINATGDMTAALQADSGSDLLEQLRTNRPHVLVMDLSMPGISGIELIRAVRRAAPSCPVLILSMYPPDQYAVRSLAAGAAGYMNKGESPAELLAAIRAVYNGSRYLTDEVAQLLARNAAGDANRAPHELLSEREFVVLRMLASGKYVGEIAAELGLSVKTISTFRLRIKQKLGLSRIAEIVRYAMDHGLVD